MKKRILVVAALVLLLCSVAVMAQANFTTSLHYTRNGKATAYSAENGGFELLTGVPVPDGCIKCHASPDAAGNIIDPATYVPSCSDCHDAQLNVVEDTCLNCHSRQKLERAKFPGEDVHQAGGLTCISCHSKEELHGDDGVEYTSLKEKGAIKVTCEQCHDSLEASASHVIHKDTVSCAGCHAKAVVNCVSCHFESLVAGGGSRPNTQITNYKLLVRYDGKAGVGSLTTHTVDGKSNVILSKFHSHVITEKGSACEDCHYNFGEKNAAIAEYNSTGMITVNKWNESTKKIEGPQGVVPIPADWKTALSFDYAVYNGDPSAATDPEQWAYMKTGSDNAHFFFAEPLGVGTMQKLGMVVPEDTPIDVFYFPLLGDGIAANIQLKTGLILTNVGDDATLELSFYDRDGAPLEVILDGGAPASMYEVDAWRGRTYSVETPGTGDSAGVLQTGYVVVKVKAPVSAMPTDISYGMTQVGGTAVFTRADDGTVVTEAGVPAAHQIRDFTVVLDSMGRSDTGLAIVNPPDETAQPASTATMTVTVWDLDFTSQIAQAQVSLLPGEAISKFIWEIFRDAGADPSVYEALKETEGSVTVTSDVAVAAVTIRQNDDPASGLPDDVPTLTVFPVIPGRADEMAASPQ
jgi:hypothetical protein